MKKCTACGVLKELSAFSKRSASSDGLDYRCRSCKLIASNKYVEDNRLKVREKQRKWAQANPEKMKSKRRAWHLKDPKARSDRAMQWQNENAERNLENKKKWDAENRDLKYKLRKEWFEQNPEKRKEMARQYRERHPEKCRSLAAAKRARKVNAVPVWSEKQIIQAIYAEARRLTAMTGVVHHVDHVVPLKHPLVCGLHVAANLQILTGEENMRKYNSFEIA